MGSDPGSGRAGGGRRSRRPRGPFGPPRPCGRQGCPSRRLRSVDRAAGPAPAPLLDKGLEDRRAGRGRDAHAGAQAVAGERAGHGEPPPRAPMHLAGGPGAARRPCMRADDPGVDPAPSSRKTKRPGSTWASSARHAARSRAGSGRSCSAARRVFCAPSQAAAAPGRRWRGSPVRRSARPSARRTPRGSARSPPPPARATRSGPPRRAAPPARPEPSGDSCPAQSTTLAGAQHTLPRSAEQARGIPVPRAESRSTPQTRSCPQPTCNKL
jgi:hypothetical protein